MKRQRKQHSAGFKAKVALEAVRGERTLNELAGQFELHPTQVVQWCGGSRYSVGIVESCFVEKRGPVRYCTVEMESGSLVGMEGGRREGRSRED